MLFVVTGGSGSGKSAFAESLILTMGEKKRYYMATMHPFDEEGLARVARHRLMRKDKGFETIERYTDLTNLDIPGECREKTVLLECMSNLVANEMFQEDGAGENTVEAVIEGVKRLVRETDGVVIVTNEIFSDGVLYPEETRTYQKYLGEINCRIAELADHVCEVVYGIPVWQKGGIEIL